MNKGRVHRNLARLREEYSQPSEPLNQGEGLRYAAVWKEAYGDDDGPYSLWTWETIEEAFSSLEDAILEGGAPEGVFDLDTGDLIEIHVAIRVTRSEEQGVSRNPLKED